MIHCSACHCCFRRKCRAMTPPARILNESFSGLMVRASQFLCMFCPLPVCFDESMASVNLEISVCYTKNKSLASLNKSPSYSREV